MYRVDPHKVSGVVHEAGLALLPHQFGSIEVIIGLAELIGRTIVEAGSNHIQMEEMAKVVNDHVMRTVRIGAHATGKGPLAKVM